MSQKKRAEAYHTINGSLGVEHNMPSESQRYLLILDKLVQHNIIKLTEEQACDLQRYAVDSDSANFVLTKLANNTWILISMTHIQNVPWLENIYESSLGKVQGQEDNDLGTDEARVPGSV